MRRERIRCNYFRFPINSSLGRNFGAVRRRDPAIAPPSDSLNEDRVLRRISQSIAQAINGADDPAIKIDVDALGPEDLANVLPAQDFVRMADEQLQSLEGQFLNLDLDATLVQFARAQIGLEHPNAHHGT